MTRNRAYTIKVKGRVKRPIEKVRGPKEEKVSPLGKKSRKEIMQLIKEGGK